MNLYFSPLSCSMASRIAFYEAGADVEFTRVDNKSKTLPDGSDFLAVNALGQVPVLHTDEGVLLTENTAILPFIADCFPEAGLAPVTRSERVRMQQWLGFVSTELHKAVFTPLLDPKAPEEAKTYVRAKVEKRFDVLQKHFATHEFLLDRFSVADAYLFVVLNWAAFAGVSLAQWPNVDAYFKRLSQRPNVARALSEEMRLYGEERLKRAKA
ncbi:glutathione binding-like protein [Dyella caseinilytica]|uniref:Glutathione S-transferase family protein n=1 Tax=Dyella caseinilytica TaxID=1849581 RepID=A0ABX7GVK2_9GAMM|nr:glutathione binding-like protein [Dyella caseinilytica]QRN54476.1 glutathione S-transferase family protein [Dyella caseinilytica]GFZ94523.1 glutathione S-transferase [Dyella caseinilytica]